MSHKRGEPTSRRYIITSIAMQPIRAWKFQSTSHTQQHQLNSYIYFLPHP